MGWYSKHIFIKPQFVFINCGLSYNSWVSCNYQPVWRCFWKWNWKAGLWQGGPSSVCPALVPGTAMGSRGAGQSQGGRGRMLVGLHTSRVWEQKRSTVKAPCRSPQGRLVPWRLPRPLHCYLETRKSTDFLQGDRDQEICRDVNVEASRFQATHLWDSVTEGKWSLTLLELLSVGFRYLQPNALCWWPNDYLLGRDREEAEGSGITV